jgi:protein involved in polysaccharide export with SLBB domain
MKSKTAGWRHALTAAGSPVTAFWIALLGLAMGSGAVATADAQQPPAEQPPGAGAIDAQPLRPGDIIRLRVWREPDYSGEFPIESNGAAVLPHVGSFNVAGMSAETLRVRLIAAYSDILLNPSISITVLRRIQVLGAVSKPGLYPVEATMSVSDAIALAGGPTAAAKKNQVVLIRDGQRIATNLAAHDLLSSSQIRSGDQILVPEQSRWMSERMFYTAVAAAVSIGITLIRGW